MFNPHFQRIKCTHLNSHYGKIKGVDRFVQHICATCWREDNNKSFHPECSEYCPFQGNWLESDRNLVQVKHSLLNPMADIFVPTSSTNVLHKPVNTFNFTIMWIKMCAFYSLKMRTIKNRFFFFGFFLIFSKLSRPFILSFSFNIFNQDRCLNFTEIFWPVDQSIFYPAYLKKTEYCDKGDKCKNLVDCDKGDNLKFKCDSFYKKFKKTKLTYYSQHYNSWTAEVQF
jgi:hypothetical protein